VGTICPKKPPAPSPSKSSASWVNECRILERVAKGRSKAARRKQAITALSGMVGAMVVARLVNDSALSNELLTVAASAFGAHKHDNQKRTAV
jgi:hypothetical protein